MHSSCFAIYSFSGVLLAIGPYIELKNILFKRLSLEKYIPAQKEMASWDK